MAISAIEAHLAGMQFVTEGDRLDRLIADHVILGRAPISEGKNDETQ
jgi:hypothetical protein